MRVGTIVKTLLLAVVLLAVPAFAQGERGVVTEDGRVLRDYDMVRDGRQTRNRLERRDVVRSSERQRSARRRSLEGGRVLDQNPAGQRLDSNRASQRLEGGRGRLLARKGQLLRSNQTRLNRSSFTARTRLYANRGRLLRQNGNGTFRRISSTYFRNPRSARKSTSTRAKTAAAKGAWVRPTWSHVKEDFNYHLHAKSADGYFQVQDPLAHETWKVRMVSHPVVRETGAGHVVQAGFAGTLGQDPTIYPVVLQFHLSGDDTTWHVKKVEVISANRIVREGKKEMVRFVPDEATQTLVVEEVFDEASYQ